MASPAPRTGAQILVDQLLAQGVKRLTCVPGESYLAVLDALLGSGLDVITCRAEGAAAMMAEAEGKLTGRPGICFVTRGPGATNASPGVHIAMQDSTPMILFVGQIERGMRGREAFQEVDYRAAFGPLAKWAVEIDDAARIPEIIARAFRTAMQGRPGPVVIGLPEDMLVDMASVVDAPYVVPAAPAPQAQDLDALNALVAKAERPLVILGGSAWTEEASLQMQALAERFDLPVATSFRRTALFPARHPCYAGDLGIGPAPSLKARVEEADLILLIGGRMSEMPSGSYTLLDVPVPKQTLVHVHPGAEELGRVYAPTLAIHATPASFLAAWSAKKGLVPPLTTPGATGVDPLSPATGGGALTAPGHNSKRAEKAHEDYLNWSETPRKLPGSFQYGEVMCWLRERLPDDTIVCNGAGNYNGWLHKHYRFQEFGTQLAPTSGSMGYGVPAAIMAKRMFPDRISIGLAGDGCFLMNGQDFATAVQYGINAIIIVIDNGQYGTIRMHQERDYPKRISATQLKNPDFAAYARAFGGYGETVVTTEEFAPAFERALASGQPAILHCFLDPRASTPGKDLEA